MRQRAWLVKKRRGVDPNVQFDKSGVVEIGGLKRSPRKLAMAVIATTVIATTCREFELFPSRRALQGQYLSTISTRMSSDAGLSNESFVAVLYLTDTLGYLQTYRLGEKVLLQSDSEMKIQSINTQLVCRLVL